MDAAGRRAEAVGIRDGHIVAVGSEAQVASALQPGTTAVDMGGRTVLPGFIDGHSHFINGALEALQVDCSTPPVATLGEVLDRLRAAVALAEPGQWVRGWGYHWSRVPERRNPTRRDLDAVAPDHPLIVIDASYHGCFVNSRALELAGIDRHAAPQHRLHGERRLLEAGRD